MLYFGEHFLSCFSCLFRESLLARLWDLMFYEANYPIKVDQLVVSVAYNLVKSNESALMQADSLQDMLLLLRLFG